MTLTVYGLKACDTCRKARKELDEAGVTHIFIDVRDDPVIAERIPVWLEGLGAQTLINKRSTTWRGLNEQERALAETAPAKLLVDHPTLMKRPVIEADGNTTVGWSREIADTLGA